MQRAHQPRVAEVHNLVILSRRPARCSEALHHRLVPLEFRLPQARRFTVNHGGRRRMLDHILCSPALAARCTVVEALNRDLPDETAMSEDDPPPTMLR